MAGLARLWVEHFGRVRIDFIERYGRDLIGELRRLQDEGHIEVMTSAATHGYLPLLSTDAAVRAQVAQGVACYQRHFGRRPRGMWLPECAYRPAYEWVSPIEAVGSREPVLRQGIEETLSEFGIEYFIVDSHLIRGGEAVGAYLDRFDALRQLWENYSSQCAPRPLAAERSPHACYLAGRASRGKPVPAVFVRDPDTAHQVWSGEWGYPADANYLDFHKKHHPGGHRYWRVTGSDVDMALKEPYDPQTVIGRLDENSEHFAGLIKRTLTEDRLVPPSQRVLCMPFDAELFGHWWFEGPQWIERVLAHADREAGLRPVTCGEALDATGPKPRVSLPEGCWGEGGFHWIWLNKGTEWTWRHVYRAEERMSRLARLLADRHSPQLERIVKQAAREVLLLESSDWQFLISTWSARDYAQQRVATHFESFVRLASMAERRARSDHDLDSGDAEYLSLCETRDAVFPGVDPRWWAPARRG